MNYMYVEHDFETDKQFHKFTTIPYSDVTKLIKTPLKCCESDPVPTILLKKINATVAPEITCIINHSLEEGHISDNLKDALLKTWNKKAGSGQGYTWKILDLYQNLSYLSKLLEQIVCNQLVNYTIQTGKIEEMQSAYCANNSTETSLLKVKTDILHSHRWTEHGLCLHVRSQCSFWYNFTPQAAKLSSLQIWDNGNCIKMDWKLPTK